MSIERPLQRYVKCDSCGNDRRVTETIFMTCKHVLCILCHEKECPLCPRERERTDVRSIALRTDHAPPAEPLGNPESKA